MPAALPNLPTTLRAFQAKKVSSLVCVSAPRVGFMAFIKPTAAVKKSCIQDAS